MNLYGSTFHLRLLTPVFLFWLAWLILRAPYQARANRLLASFLGLVALGFGFEYVADFFSLPHPVASGLLWLSQAVGILDPPVLLAFALAVAGRGRVVLARWVWGFYAALAGALLIAAILKPPFTDEIGVQFPTALQLALLVYVNGTYLVGFLLVLTAYLGEERRFLAHELRFLSLGIGFAALSRCGALFYFHDLVPFLFGRELVPGESPTFYVTFAVASLAFTLAVLAVVYGILRLSRPQVATRLDEQARNLAALLVAFFGSFAAIGWAEALGSTPSAFTHLFFPFRWLVFALLIGYGILRHQLFDFELKTRQAIAILATAMVGVAVAVATTLLADERQVGFLAVRLLGALAGAAFAWPVYATSSRLVRWWSPATESPAEADRRRLELYEAMLENAAQKKEWSSSEQLFFEALREVFEITSEEHQRILARLQQAPTRLVPSAK